MEKEFKNYVEDSNKQCPICNKEKNNCECTKKEMLSKAYKEGKIIQFNSSGEWKDFEPQNQVDRPNFDYKIDNWRIKPGEPNLNTEEDTIMEVPMPVYSKEETLEEAANDFSSDNYYATQSECFIAGAKWQAERMYTEEEVITLLLDFLGSNESFDISVGACSGFERQEAAKWFEQFKKKS